MKPLLVKRLSGLVSDANEMSECCVGSFVDEERLTGQKRNPRRSNPLKIGPKFGVPKLGGKKSGNGEEDAKLRIDADVPVGVEVDESGAFATFSVLITR